jgi:hypothetical protein
MLQKFYVTSAMGAQNFQVNPVAVSAGVFEVNRRNGRQNDFFTLLASYLTRDFACDAKIVCAVKIFVLMGVEK